MEKAVNAVNIFVLYFCKHMLILGWKGAFALILAVYTLILAFLPLIEHLQCQKNVKSKAAMAKMDAARQFDTACEQEEAIQPDLQIKEFLSILCYQKV